MDTSAAVRSWTQARLRVAQDRREVHYRDKLAGRDEHTEAAERRRITQRAVGVIARKVRRDGTAKRSTLTAALPSKYRSVVSVDEVIAEAIDLDYMRLEGDQYVPGGKVHK